MSINAQEEQLQTLLHQRNPRFQEALRVLKAKGLDDAVAIATEFRSRAVALIATEVESERMAQMEHAGSAARQIMTALPEELLLDGNKPIPGMHELHSIYMNIMATGRVNPSHETRILLPFAAGAELIRVILEKKRKEHETPQTPEAVEDNQLPDVI